MVLQLRDKYCNRCNEKYTDAKHNWCRPCLKDFTNLSGKNEIIDDFIQEVQSKIKSYRDIVFEWIPYDQFIDVKEIGKGGFATIYLATWNGPLKYDTNAMKYRRYPDRVALKCLHNAQNITNEFLNEV